MSFLLLAIEIGAASQWDAAFPVVTKSMEIAWQSWGFLQIPTKILYSISMGCSLSIRGRGDCISFWILSNGAR